MQQPRGFEPIGALRVLREATGLAALDGEDVSQLHVDWNPATCTVTREADPDERQIAIRLNLHRVHLKVGISLDPSPYLLSYLVDALVNAGVRIIGVVHVDAVGMPEVQRGQFFLVRGFS